MILDIEKVVIVIISQTLGIYVDTNLNHLKDWDLMLVEQNF